jgi:type III pantothenate kinase
MSEQLILAIDVGNTRAKFGAFKRADSMASQTMLPECIASIAVAVAGELDWGKVTAQFKERNAKHDRAVVAGANPAGVDAVISCWPGGFGPAPVAVRCAADLPLRVNVEFPDKVGIDRLLDGVAANALRALDQPVVVVDAGTATTVNFISAQGAFEGGAILPGLELGARALHQYTALLPLIDVPSLLLHPGEPLGRNTPAAIGSGLWFGQVGAVRELVTRLSESAGRPPLVLVTGGNGRWLAPALGSHVRFEPDLALRGLAFVAQSQELP